MKYQVKKYNFDMIEKFPGGSTSTSNLYCSLTCLESHSTHQVTFGICQTLNISP